MVGERQEHIGQASLKVVRVDAGFNYSMGYNQQQQGSGFHAGLIAIDPLLMERVVFYTKIIVTESSPEMTLHVNYMSIYGKSFT